MGGEAESPDVLGAEGLVGAVLGLEDDGGLDDLEAVPGARGDVHPVAALVAAEPQARGLTAAVVVEHHVYLPAQQQLGLGGAAVPVHGDLRPALQRVQHPLRTVRGRVAQVAVHPQPRRRLGLSGQGVKKGVVNQHRSVFVFVFAAVLVAGSPCAQVLLMEMVVLLHEDDVGRAEHKQHAAEVSPADAGGGSGEQDCAGADDQLQQRVERRHEHVTDAQLVGHQLVGVLAVRLPEVLMQHHAVADGQHHVHPVDRQQHYPAQVAGAQNQRAESEEHDERDGHRAHVAGEAARPRAEVEEAEHQRGYGRDGQQTPVDERLHELVEVGQRQQHGERVAPGDAVDAVHEVPGVDYAHEQHQRHEHVPPGEAAAEEAELQEHQGHGGELGHEADGVGQRAHVVGELNGCEQYQPEDEPGVAEAAEQEEEDGRQREYDSPAADGGPGVGAAPVGPVDYPEACG